MTTFRLDIHIAAGWDGNLCGIADQFPIRTQIEFEASDNSGAMDYAADQMTVHACHGDIGRVYRFDTGHDWQLLGEVLP